MRIRRIVLCAAICAVAALLSVSGSGQDFSGTYTAQPSSASKTDDTLIVVQSKDAVEITRREQGKTRTNRCPFSGSGPYTSSGGIPGTCTAKIKGGSILVDSIVNTANASLHTREQWQLSKNLKTLTIRSRSDAPDLPNVSAALGDTLSSTSKYTREQPGEVRP
jgi:hypothetical protein